MDEFPPRPVPQRGAGQRLNEWVAWFGLGRLVAIAVSVALVGVGGYWLVAPPPPPVENSLPMASSATPSAVPSVPAGPNAPAPATSAVPVDIVVHVAGAVQQPGIHRVPPEARVADAVLAAGGLAPDADPDAINLAAPLADGDRVYVPRVSDGVVVPVGVTGAGGAAEASSGGPPRPVSINGASADELDALPGVGPATAAAIVAHRDRFGPFSSIDGLADVRGIGPTKLEAIRPLVTL